MKSRTSFFNRTVLRKDILRYSPVWALYTILLLLILFGISDYARATIARNVVDFLKGMAWLNLIYGGVCGIFLFMDLFNSRLCNALHAFPVRREGWLTTHILAGFLFCFIPNLLAAGVGALLLWEYAYIALIWLAISTMQFLFFFGTAVLAATCAGNLLGAVAVYGITHFVTLFVYGVAQQLYQPLLFGVQLNEKLFLHFYPLNKMSGFDFVNINVLYENVKPQVEFNGLQREAWLYVGICTAVGIGALFLACLIYRRRNLETAGDFVSLKPMAPLFILVCTVGAGVFLYMFSGLVENATYLFLVLGMIIGYFVGKMLLNRTLKVFGKKSLLTLMVLMAVIGGSLLVTWLDPLGITTYVPDTESIEYAHIYGADKGRYYLPEALVSYTGYENESGYDITEANELAELREFHRQLTDYRPTKDDDVLCDVRIHYKLKSGRTVTRYYRVGRNTPLGQKAGEYFNDMRYIFEVNDTDILYNVFESVVINVYEDGKSISHKLTDQQDIADVLDAIAADCQAGTMSQNWAYHKENSKDTSCHLQFHLKDEVSDQGVWDSTRFILQIYEDSLNTISYVNGKIAASDDVTKE